MIRLAVALQLADLATFLAVALAHPGLVATAELSPLRYLWSAGDATSGLLLVIAAKCAAVALVLAVTAVAIPQRQRLVLSVMALVGAVGVAANVGAMA